MPHRQIVEVTASDRTALADYLEAGEDGLEAVPITPGLKVLLDLVEKFGEPVVLALVAKNIYRDLKTKEQAAADAPGTITNLNAPFHARHTDQSVVVVKKGNR